MQKPQREHKFQLESDAQLTRLASNFFQSKTQGEYSANDVNVVKEFFNYAIQSKPLKKYKVAFCFIVLNPLYWQYAPKAIEGAKSFFLPDHQVDYFVWSDLPSSPELIKQKLAESYLRTGEAKASMIDASSVAIMMDDPKIRDMEKLISDLVRVRKENNFFEIESVEWPLPTLFRYHTFLQEEEKLSEYDYIFYCDVDMAFANYVGDEVLGNGLTAAQHPMYALRREYNRPYEPNPESSAYIKQSGRMNVDEKGTPHFEPLYFAGGFQGGRSADWIKAMKAMKKTIDLDFEKKNYIAIWNDESHWNKYLSENPPAIVLSPAYIYPDSLIQEYYVKLWGRNYSPKIITITKKFSLSKEGGQAVMERMKTL